MKNLSRLAKIKAQGMGLMPETQKFNTMYDQKNLKLKSARAIAGESIAKQIGGSFVKRGKGRKKQIEKSRSLAERVAKIKATPRPTIPTKKKKPKFYDAVVPVKPVDNTDNVVLIEAVEDHNRAMDERETRDRVFLVNMIQDALMGVDHELYEAVIDAIYSGAVSRDTIIDIAEMYGEDLRDVYENPDDYDDEDKETILRNLYKALKGKEWEA